MFLCNSSILPGAPLRPCWNVWQTKAFVAILMQINCITNNLVFHSPLQGHNHSLWGLTSLLSTCTRAAPSCPVILSTTKEDEEQRGAQGRAPSWAHRQQNGQKTQMSSTKTALCVVQSQPGTSDFPPYDPASINNMHHPSSTSTAEDPSPQLSGWEELL